MINIGGGYLANLLRHFPSYALAYLYPPYDMDYDYRLAYQGLLSSTWETKGWRWKDLDTLVYVTEDDYYDIGIYYPARYYSFNKNLYNVGGLFIPTKNFSYITTGSVFNPMFNFTGHNVEISFILGFVNKPRSLRFNCGIAGIKAEDANNDGVFEVYEYWIYHNDWSVVETEAKLTLYDKIQLSIEYNDLTDQYPEYLNYFIPISIKINDEGFRDAFEKDPILYPDYIYLKDNPYIYINNQATAPIDSFGDRTISELYFDFFEMNNDLDNFEIFISDINFATYFDYFNNMLYNDTLFIDTYFGIQPLIYE